MRKKCRYCYRNLPVYKFKDSEASVDGLAYKCEDCTEYDRISKANRDALKHNLGRTRKYVKHFSRRNLEMRELLEFAGFPTSDNER